MDYDKNTIETLWHYRQGMMHHFSPKLRGQFAGICKNYINSTLFIRDNASGEVSLNVTVLSKDFIDAIIKFKLFIGSNNDEKIFDTIIKGLKNLDYYIHIPPTVTKRTTINPGTPKNK